MSDHQESAPAPPISLDPLKGILEEYKSEVGALIPVLQQTQEVYGYLPQEAIKVIAKAMRMSATQVYGVVTFYSQFHTKPRGKHVITVCRGTTCHVRGARQILEALEKDLGIEDGETTPDLEFTLETVACIGACGLAPTMVIGDTTHGQVTVQKAQKLLEDLRAEA